MANNANQIAANIKAIEKYIQDLRNANSALSTSLDIQERLKAETEIEAANKLLTLERERLIADAKENNRKLTADEKNWLGIYLINKGGLILN